MYVLKYKIIFNFVKFMATKKVRKKFFLPPFCNFCIQCSENVTFWYGCGSLDLYLWLTDLDVDPDPAPDADPALFVSDLQDANKSIFCFYDFFLFEGTFSSFFKVKKSYKEVTKNSRNQGFSSFFFLVDGRIRYRILSWTHTKKIWIRMQIQEAQIHTDSTDLDLDPKHWLNLWSKGSKNLDG